MQRIFLKPDDFDINNIEFSEVKINKEYKAKMVYVNYIKNDIKHWITLQTPMMNIPYGLSIYPKENGGNKYVVSLSFGNIENNQMYEAFSKLDKLVFDTAKSQSVAWFGIPQKKATDDKIEDKISKLVTYSKNKETGEPNTKYPPTFKVNIPVKNGELDCLFFNTKKEKIDVKPEDLENLISKGSKAKAIIEASVMWIGTKTSLTWKIVQMMVEEKTSLKEYAFNDSDDEDSAINESATKKEDEDDDDDDDDAVVEDSDVDEAETA